MPQNIYDDPQFFREYSLLRRSRHGLDAAPEWPALRALLPDLTGLNVLDLGCGYGWFCRWAREHGAAHVLGLDLSDRMLAQARTMTADPAIEYRNANLDHLALPPSAFSLAFSSLALHYVEDLKPLLAELRRALIPNAHFVFSIEHPIYMAPQNAEWHTDSHGRISWPVNSYAVEGPRSANWLTKPVLKHHRTIGTTLNALIDAGFAVHRVHEWAPTPQQIAADATLSNEIDRPMFLLVAASAKSQ